MNLSRRRATGGFTMIELLTVSGIIVLLAALVMTAVFAAQEAGRVSVCRNNLAQMYKLVTNYTTNYDGYIPSMWHERWVGELGLTAGHWREDYTRLIQRPEIAQMYVWWRLYMANPANAGLDPPNVSDPYWVKIRNRGRELYRGWSGYKRVTNTDDIIPLVPRVWNNYSSTTLYFADERPVFRTGSPLIRCPSDMGGFHCDQGVDVSYMGLAKYGWWHRGDCPTTARYFESHQIQEVQNPSRAILLMETEPGTWQFGGCG